MKLKLLTIFITFLFFTNISAQDLSANDSLLLQAIGNLNQAIDNWNEADLQSNRAQLERLLDQNDQKYLVHYYIAFAEYNLVNFYQAQKKEDMLAKLLDDGVEHLEQAIQIDVNFAEAYGLLSSLLGQKIGLSPIKGIFLGPKSGSNMATALELDPNNPRLHYLAGVNAFFTPAMFGGGIDIARNSLKQAIDLFKTYKVTKRLYPQWGEREAYTWLGIIAAKSDSLKLAHSYYKSALEISPGFKWVELELLPNLNKKTASDE